MTTTVLEPCPKAKKVMTLIARRNVYKLRCKPDCPSCKGKAYVQTCPDCDGAGLLLGSRCGRCGATGKIPGQPDD